MNGFIGWFLVFLLAIPYLIFALFGDLIEILLGIVDDITDVIFALREQIKDFFNL